MHGRTLSTMNLLRMPRPVKLLPNLGETCIFRGSTCHIVVLPREAKAQALVASCMDGMAHTQHQLFMRT